MAPYEMQSVPVSLDKMKMLFWRLDLSKRSFVALNDCTCGVLGLENYRFFKDRKYRERIIFPDDLTSLDSAFNSFKERVTMRTIFRVQSGGSIHWFKLTGWPTDDRRYYEGAVEDISEHISRLKSIFNQQDLSLLEIADADYPIAIFSEQDNNLLDGNSSFQELFNIDLSLGLKLFLKDLITSETNLPLLLETLLLEGQLETELWLASGNDVNSSISCLFKHFTYAGEGYIRLAVVDLPDETKPVRSESVLPVPRQDVMTLCQKLASCFSIDEMLNQVYESRSLFPGMDSIMFSDVYARQNKVVVYSKGTLLEPLEPASQYSYTGTIAENIDKENLEYLIVDDTQSSIKAIDWVLFVPKGIHSYVAKALYVRGAMRTVLIFCSQQKNIFNEDHVVDVTAISTAFHSQLKAIRKKSRSTSR
ncbi:MAG: hypothetical protein DRH06_04660 [Deltaproteobacteria bacterium]|nr:MAG: hypothetical protein DRH06_04660 [Deltaproteobacteria bacterium]